MPKEAKEVSVYDLLSVPIPKDKTKTLQKGGAVLTTFSAYVVVERLTSVFGLMGIGWGIRDLEFKPQEDGSIVAQGNFWAKTSAGELVYPAIGDGDLIKKRDGTVLSSVAEVYKKAYTNLIKKAASFIGVGMEIYSGDIDDLPPVDAAPRTYPTPASPTNGVPRSADSFAKKEFKEPKYAREHVYNIAFDEKDSFKEACKEHGVKCFFRKPNWVAEGDVPGYEWALIKMVGKSTPTQMAIDEPEDEQPPMFDPDDQPF